MREIIMIKTIGGDLHKTKQEALRHLEKMYTKKSLPLQEALAHLPATKIGVFLRENISEFLELSAIIRDIDQYEPYDEEF